jgi:hypothetical protein
MDAWLARAGWMLAGSWLAGWLAASSMAAWLHGCMADVFAGWLAGWLAVRWLFIGSNVL